MLGIKSFRVHPEARSAFSHRLRTVSVEHLPRQNRLLATLPEAVYARLLADLEPVPLLAGQITVCNRHHSLEKRLCRWLLSSLDRLNSAELAVTHELISHVLGVRREGVTQALGSLRNAGLIEQTRGHIILVDRPRLEALVCECYAIVRQESDARLIPETSWSEHASARPGTGPVRPKVSSFGP